MNIDFRIPLHVIESKYGPGNFDDAGDDIALLFRRAVDQAKCSYRFDIDGSHPNPWYHALVFSVDGLTEKECASLRAAWADAFE